jgi:hypothetical protein
VAGGGPATGRREREVSSALHGRETMRGGSGAAHWGRGRDGGGGRTATGFRHGRGGGFGLGEHAVG